MGKNHPNVDPYVVSRVRALESLLLEKGILAPDAVDRVIQRYENDTGPMIGARATARAWADPGYKRLLLEDSKAALAQFGLAYDVLLVVENTPAVHNMVVCTLCSCYPWPVLGLPPTWYKMPAYRSRAVSEPRSVLKEFGLEIPADREIRVWDSSAEMRYMVLPRRPAGTEGLGEEALVPLINRDALIGVAEVTPPALPLAPPLAPPLAKVR
jgi:nitrile hydratase